LVADDTVTLVRKPVNYIGESVVDTYNVFNAVDFHFPSENATRWNRTYFMLEKFLQAIVQFPQS
jgi:hypothetical protein